ncbi:MAG: hypothetical protein QGH40_02630 [bacterium]|nr:hypothetical protein [bacterium]
MKKTSVYQICLVFLLVIVMMDGIACLPARSETQVRRFSEMFGYLDVASCIVFHPLLDYYSIGAETFTRKPPPGQTKEQVREEMVTKLRERGRLVRSAKEKIEKFRQEIRVLEKEKTKIQGDMKIALEKERLTYLKSLGSTELESEIKAFETEYTARCEEIESEYLDRVKKTRTKIEEYGNTYRNLKQQVNQVIYQGVHEKQATVKTITEDIELVTRLVAKKREISVIVNTSVIRETRRKEPENWENIFREQYDYERFEAALFEGWFEPADLYHEYSRRYQQKNEFLKPFGTTRLLNDVFVVGGTDLTEDVIKGLLIKYKVSGRRMDEALKIYREARESRFGW